MINKTTPLLVCSALILMATITACDHHDEHKHEHHEKNDEHHDKHGTHKTINNDANHEEKDAQQHETHDNKEDSSEIVSLDSHEHGIAEINLSFIDEKLSLELLSPAYNIVGFEHQPNKDQKQTVARIEKALTAKNNLPFIINGSECAATDIHINSPFKISKHGKHSNHDQHKPHDEHHDEHKKDEHLDKTAHENHAEGIHSEYTLEYELNCKNTISSPSLDFSPMFTLLPNIERIKLNWLTANKQNSIVLTKKETLITL